MSEKKEESKDKTKNVENEEKELIARLESQEERCVELASYLLGHIVRRTSAHVNEQCSSLIESSKESIGYVPLSRNAQFESHKELIGANLRCKYRKSTLCWAKPQSTSASSTTADHRGSPKPSTSKAAATASPQIVFPEDFGSSKSIIQEGSPCSTSSSTITVSVDSNEVTPPSSVSGESPAKQKSTSLLHSYLQSVLTAKTGEQNLPISPIRQRKQPLKDVPCEYPLFENTNPEGVSRLSYPILDEIDEFSRKSKYAVKESIKSIYRDPDDTETDSDFDEPDDDFEYGGVGSRGGGGEEYDGDESQEDDDRPFKYLPVEESPKAIWAKDRMDHISRMHLIQYKLEQLAHKKKEDTEFIKYIRSKKPPFVFDESAAGPSTPTKYNVPSASPRSQIHYFTESNGKTNRHVVRCTSNLDSLGSYIFNNSAPDDESCTARRCLPVKPFHPRKIFQVGGIHNLTAGSNSKTYINCDCRPRVELCGVCTGKNLVVRRTNNDLKSRKDVNALLDHTYHKNLTSRRNLAGRTKLLIQEALSKDLAELSIKNSDVNRLKKMSSRLPLVSPHVPVTETLLDYVLRRAHELNRPLPTNRVVKRERGRYIKKNRPPNSNNNKGGGSQARRKKLSFSKMDDDDSDASFDGEEGLTPFSSKKKRKDSQDFDINKFVIPYSIAASTRVEKLSYKEIVTPTWRTFNDYKEAPLETEDLNGEVEDISEEAIQARHERGLIEEARKFLKNSMFGKRGGNRQNSRNRTDSKTENSDPNTPDPISDPASPQSHEFNNWDIPSSSTNASLVTAADATLAASALKCNPPRSNGRRRRRSSRRIISSEEDEGEEGDEDFNDLDEKGFTPFEPRVFPLPPEEYEDMKRMMPANF